MVVLVALFAAAVAAVYVSGMPAGSSPCMKPPGGFLIIASGRGFNDSMDHGAPTSPWPVASVTRGSTVTFVVCNEDTQPHSFQVAHYHDSALEAIAPGKVLTVSFVANETGTFRIYCAIPFRFTSSCRTAS